MESEASSWPTGLGGFTIGSAIHMFRTLDAIVVKVRAGRSERSLWNVNG
jgi:hypothetical protein